MKNKRTQQVITIVICLLIAILGGILQVKNLKEAEPISIHQFFSDSETETR